MTKDAHRPPPSPSERALSTLDAAEAGSDAPRPEESLLRRLRRRDEAAFNQLVRAHQAPIYRLLARLLGDAAEAEDVAQEVFVSAFKAIGDFRGDAALSTWLYRIAHNHAINRIKYRARRAIDAQRPLDERIAAAASGALGVPPVMPDALLEAAQAERDVGRALLLLEDEQRMLVSLRDLQHSSYEEIRQLTGLPIGTIKSKLHRARSALQRHFLALRGES